MDYGTVQNPSLPILSKKLRSSLSMYEHYIEKHSPHRFDFGVCPDLAFTPDKPNTARSLVPVMVDGAVCATLYAILFCPGDGTGDENTYKAGSLKIPPELQTTPQAKIIPRKKTAALEAFLPFFSAGTQCAWNHHTSLLEVTVEENAVTPLFQLTESGSATPTVYLTAGYLRNGKRFGDPHAIYCPPNSHYNDRMQMAGFIAAEEGSPLCEIFEKVARVPRFIKPGEKKNEFFTFC